MENKKSSLIGILFITFMFVQSICAANRFFTKNHECIYTNVAIIGDYLIQTYGDSAVAGYYKESVKNKSWIRVDVTFYRSGLVKMKEINDSISDYYIRKYFDTNVVAFNKALAEFIDRQDYFYYWCTLEGTDRRDLAEICERFESDEYTINISFVMELALTCYISGERLDSYKMLKRAIDRYKNLKYKSIRELLDTK